MSTELHRRALLLAALPLLTAAAPPPIKQTSLKRAGFLILSRMGGARLAAYHQTWDALARQIDIVAGCGAKSEIMDFFRKQRIAAVVKSGGGGGLYTAKGGIEIDVAPLPPPNNPVLLHELLHALHHDYLPQGNANPDVERFYNAAVQNDLFPNAKYMLKNKGEYFATSGSLFLWGTIARAPSTRANLKAAQSDYYDWLCHLFGICPA